MGTALGRSCWEARPQVSSRFLIDRVNVAALLATRQKHTVYVPEKGLGFFALAKLRILDVLALSHPLSIAVHEVRSKDDPYVVKLEALRGVDASHLIEAAGICSP